MNAGRTLTWALVLGMSMLLVACSGSSDNGNNGNGKADASVGDGPGTSDGTAGGDGAGTTSNQVGDPCDTDEGCESGICFAGLCAKACTQPSDCAADQDCGSDDGIRLLCYKRTYNPEIGASCALKGSCTDSSLECFGGTISADAYCSAPCEDNTDCPPQMDCREATEDEKKYCVRRGFCAHCSYDEMCGPDHKCIRMGAKSYCTRACNIGRFECPKFAECKAIKKDEFYCFHKSGACTATGKLCDPCVTETDCGEEGGMCLHVITTKEAFCSAPCNSGQCPSGYTCFQEYQECVPDLGAQETPRCVDSLSPTMEEGDIMTDFAMVGYIDSNNDGSLVGEKLKIIKLSDYASTHKVILFNVSAGWCGACHEETKDHAELLSTYGPQGLMIVQVLFDDDQPEDLAPLTVGFLDVWVNALKPAGAVGLDPNMDTFPLNTDGSTPLNMLLDAKTRKVLKKGNGYNRNLMEADIQAALNAATP